MKKTKSLYHELDMLLQKRRDKAAARRFFKCVPAVCPDARKDRQLSVTQLFSHEAVATAEMSLVLATQGTHLIRFLFVAAVFELASRMKGKYPKAD